ncbi:MAG: NAD-dependent epimerase/dehydratase family protein [Planctomycetes bacterium]|nr:NAD-dependent epimerase/dehydratase family protein [Planctomycetota bacterium]
MKALVVGGAGFIGSHLSEALLRRGYDVCVLDDLSTGKSDNIAGLEGKANFSFKIGSIMNETLLSRLIEESDVVFHLAAVVGVKLMLENLVRSIETNAYGTGLVLKYAAEKKKCVVLFSSSEVYGRSVHVPFREDDSLILGTPYQGRWSYGCSKLIGEYMARAYSKEAGLPVVVVRPFNTVGPRQSSRYGMVIPRFVEQALSDEPITVFGDGTQSRCFVYVTDVVDAVIDLSERPEASGQIFNVGSDEEVTIQDLAIKIKELTNSKSEVTYIPYEEVYSEGLQDMERRVPCLEKIKKHIRYEPSLDLNEILDKVIAHKRSELQATTVATKGQSKTVSIDARGNL